MPERKTRVTLPKSLSIWLEPRNYLSPEVGKDSYGEFLKNRMATHLRVNRAIIGSISNPLETINGKENASVRDILEKETLDLMRSKSKSYPELNYPSREELKLLTNHQIIELQHNFVADCISKSESPEADMLFFDMEFVRQTGILIKYLDYFDLARPDRLNRTWGDGTHQDPKKTKIGKVEPWIMKSSLNHLELNSFPEEIRPIVAGILDQSYINEVGFQDFPAEIRQRNIGNRPHSSVESDLLHQVVNLAMRIDKVTNVAKDYLRIPSPYELSLMEYSELVSLYKNFTTYFLHLFQSKEVQESTVEWYGKSLNAKEFLTTTLEHVMLHQGSLQFFELLENTQ